MWIDDKFLVIMDIVEECCTTIDDTWAFCRIEVESDLSGILSCTIFSNYNPPKKITIFEFYNINSCEYQFNKLEELLS